MTAQQLRLVELTEYKPRRFASNEVPGDVGTSLWPKYGDQVVVAFPSPKTDGQWELTAQGWVGYIPLPEQDLLIALQPKVDIGNIFRMLEYAYNLRLHFPEGLVGCESLREFYERLANVLAKRVLDRARKGFYRTYIPETDTLPYLRGRLDMQEAVRRPWNTGLRCHFEEHTSDVEENQILAWTLLCITRSGMCTERVIPTVRQAYRALLGFATLVPCRAKDCVGRLYTRLNDDYQPLHALSRFFLEHSGPSYEVGGHTMLPFLIDMAALYELFVAEWLRLHLPPNLMLRRLERVYISEEESLHFEIDLYLQDTESDRMWVLDTKYKAPESGPATSDIAQVVAYAEAKSCHEAILVYPTMLPSPLRASIGDIHVRSMTFSLDGDLEGAGQAFLQQLLASH